MTRVDLKRVEGRPVKKLLSILVLGGISVVVLLSTVLPALAGSSDKGGGI